MVKVSKTITLKDTVYRGVESLLIKTQADTGKRLTFSDMVEILLKLHEQKNTVSASSVSER